jgi:hypothetical protein
VFSSSALLRSSLHSSFFSVVAREFAFSRSRKQKILQIKAILFIITSSTTKKTKKKKHKTESRAKNNNSGEGI